ncbi:MAG TPA: hypothetical protein VGR30_20300 [Candidatus Binatia bacterium]|jgi:hypothetical protein|nr:hypothetical protein [Candidatus Binatia bacterium]
MKETATPTKLVEVYFPSAVIRGSLVTRHDRLSNHLNLRSEDDVASLVEASVRDLSGNPLQVGSGDFTIYTSEMLLVVDLMPTTVTERSAWDHAQVKKEPRAVLLGIGPFWLRGTAHLMPGAQLSNWALVKQNFIPVTDATVLNQPEREPCTILVNRVKISWLVGDHPE